MSNVKVKSVGAVFNGQPIGSTIELTEAEAEHYVKLGYVELIPESKAKAKPATQSESAPKADKPTPKKRKATPKDK